MLDQYTLKSKLAALSISFIFFIVGLISYSVYSIQISGELIKYTYDKPLMSSNFARDALVYFHRSKEYMIQEGYDEDDFEDLFEGIADDLEVVEERIVGEPSPGHLRIVRRLLGQWHALAEENKLVEMEGIESKIEESIDLLIESEFSAGYDFTVEAQQSTADFAALVISIGVLFICIAMAGSYYLFISIFRPITACVDLAESIASGNLNNDISIKGSPEFRTLLQAFQRMQTDLVHHIEQKQGVLLEEKNKESLAAQRLLLSNMGEELNQEVSEIISLVAISSRDLSQIASEMADAIAESSSHIDVAGDAIQETSESSADVSSSSQELASSIDMIKGNVSKTASVITEAVQVTEEAALVSDQLNQSIQDINHVTALIHSISEQTNLLALNATIEAARAGDAGRGFAVVAGEVKTLASQTAAATNTITEQIQKVDGVSQSVVGFLDKIKESIRRIEQFSSSVSDSVSSQAETTTEINAKIQATSSSVENISAILGQVNQSSVRIKQFSENVQSISLQLESNSDSLNSSVSQFINKLSN